MSTSIRDKVGEAEWTAREDLAALFRMVALHGWDDGINGYITARVPDHHDELLVNPEIFFDEITASNLMKVDKGGKPVFDSQFTYRDEAFHTHAPIYEAIPEAACIVHLHMAPAIAVGCQEAGLLPVHQISTSLLRNLGYHEYDGLGPLLDDKQRHSFALSLKKTPVLLLRNHGILLWCPTIRHAWLRTRALGFACELQERAQAMAGGAKLHLASSAAVEKNKSIDVQRSAISDRDGHKAWAAVRRRLDRTQPDYRS